MKGKLSSISLGFLLIISLIGTLMRATPFIGLPVDYTHLLHAHSHVAFQGWIYTVIFLLTTHVFLLPGQFSKGKYPLQFSLTIVVLAGILISFTLQGYAFFSILFSSLFQLLNYWFIYSLLRDLRMNYGNSPPVSVRFIRTGLWLGVLSTLGPWLIGVLVAKGLAQSEAYQSTIYFFMHFQYNGWFLFSALGILFHWLEKTRALSWRENHFYRLSLFIVFPSYLFSLTGMSFGSVLFLPALLTILLQLYATYVLVRILRGKQLLNTIAPSVVIRVLLIASFFAYIIKSIVQIGTLLPTIDMHQFNNRFMQMFYLHLSLIGALSLFFLAGLVKYHLISNPIIAKWGTVLLIVGFVGSELILFLNGSGIFIEPIYLLIFSALMGFGIFCFLISFLTNRDKNG